MTTEDIKQFMADRLAEMSDQKGFNQFEMTARRYSTGEQIEYVFSAYNEILGHHMEQTAEDAIEKFKKSMDRSRESLIRKAAEYRAKAELCETQAASL